MAYNPPTLDPSLPNPSFVGFLVDEKHKHIIYWVKIYPHDLPVMTMKAKKELFMKKFCSNYVTLHLKEKNLKI